MAKAKGSNGRIGDMIKKDNELIKEAISHLTHLIDNWTEDMYMRGGFSNPDKTRFCALGFILHNTSANTKETEFIEDILYEESGLGCMIDLNDNTDHHTTVFYSTKVRDRLKSMLL